VDRREIRSPTVSIFVVARNLKRGESSPPGLPELLTEGVVLALVGPYEGKSGKRFSFSKGMATYLG
jgi:hypothetical protein